MRKQIPNLITCMNVISGTLAIFLAMYGLLTAAAYPDPGGDGFRFFRRDDRPSVACQVGDRERDSIRWPIWSVSGLLLLFWRIF